MTKLSNDKLLELIIEDLESWMQGNDYDGDLEYAFENGYHLHAANLWLSSGAMSQEVTDKINENGETVFINRTKELKEIDAMLKEAYIYECEHCNHHGFYNDDQGPSVQLSWLSL